MDFTGITFASLLTPEGVVFAGGATTAFVELIKRVFPSIDARVSGALMAFAATAVLYVLTLVATNVSTMDASLTVFLAWLSCATTSVGISATATHIAAIRGGTDE